jgi:hypothetical protein
MLEPAGNSSFFPGRHIAGTSEPDLENVGLLLSRKKDMLIAACGGNPELLSEIGGERQRA